MAGDATTFRPISKRAAEIRRVACEAEEAGIAPDDMAGPMADGPLCQG